MALILPAWRIITRRKRRNDRLGSDVNWRRLTSQQGRALVARLVGGGKRDSKRMTIAPITNGVGRRNAVGNAVIELSGEVLRFFRR